MMDLNRYRSVLKDLPEGCRAAEVNVITIEETEISCEKGQVTSASASEHVSLFLRATGEKTGTVYTENPEDDPAKLIRKALSNAELIDQAEAQPFAKGRTDAVGEAIGTVDPEALKDYTKKLSLRPGIVTATANARLRVSRVLNSNGLDTELKDPVFEVSVGVPGKGEDNYKMMSRSAKVLEEIDVDEMLAKLNREQAYEHEELPFIDLPAGQYDVVIGRPMTQNIMNTAWQLFSKWDMENGESAFEPGQKIGSPLLKIVDAARSPYTGYDFSIDYEGVRGAAKKVLVKNGVITDMLTTLSDDGSGGNAGRENLLSGSLKTALMAIPRNIWIEGGAASVQELIDRMGTGIHLTYSIDEYHSTNIAAGTFAIPCGGVYYRDGKAVGRVQQMNLYGSFEELFSALEYLGNDVELAPMETYRSYCFGGPSMLMRGLNLSM